MTSIAVDIDSTLYDFETPFRQACLDLAFEREDKEKYFKAAYHSWVQWRSPADIDFSIFMEALDVVHSPEVIRSREPFEGSVDVIGELWEQGSDLIYISNRAPETEEATREWLVKSGFPPGDLICTNDSKREYMADCRYLIDDRPKTMVEFVYDRDWEFGERKAFSKLYEYNEALTDIPNCYLAPTWAGIRYYLEQKGVLNGRGSSIAI